MNIAVIWCAFTIRKGREKDGKTAVYASITINKDKVLIALKHYVEVDVWDKGHVCIKVRLPQAKETNAYLELEIPLKLTAAGRLINLSGILRHRLLNDLSGIHPIISSSITYIGKNNCDESACAINFFFVYYIHGLRAAAAPGCHNFERR